MRMDSSSVVARWILEASAGRAGSPARCLVALPSPDFQRLSPSLCDLGKRNRRPILGNMCSTAGLDDQRGLWLHQNPLSDVSDAAKI